MANKYRTSGIAWCLGFILSLLFIRADAATRVNAVQATNFGSYTRVIINVNDVHQYHVFTLAHPDRVVIDLQNARLKARLKDVHFTDSDIIQVRSGHPGPSILRLVFDMNVPAQIKNFIAEGNSRHEAQVVVDIYPQTKHYMPAVVSETVEKPKPIKTSSLLAVPVKNLKKTPKIASTSPAVVATNTVYSALTKTPALQAPAIMKPRRVTVVVDAGHGGKDPGTVGPGGTKEKDVVLAIALRLAELINKEPNMRAVLTRKGDYFVTLRQRLRLARKDKADLFIAIHADSYLDDNSQGASVYALSRHGATTEAARWLAKRENYSELGGVDFSGLGDQSYLLRSVLIDLAQTATITDSLRLGTNVLDELEKVTRLHYSRVEQAPFVVLKSPDIPSILVEMGFLSNPMEELRLRTKEHRDILVHALVGGISHYVATHPMMASNTRLDVITKYPV